MAKRIVLLSFCIAIGCIVAASMWSTPVNAQETGEAAAADAVFIDFKHLALLVIESVVFSIVGGKMTVTELKQVDVSVLPLITQ